jgi:hypothetical protein
VGKATAAFRANHDQHFLDQSLEDRSNMPRYREWAAQLSAWLYSTEHIRIGYSIQYDGVEIEQLSPGTRGIVLLLLYLSIDRNDDRPLIIDQPEENLDPKSVFDELVQGFAHNANLVVNSDADQVIFARAGNHRPGALPSISYLSGGLENLTSASGCAKSWREAKPRFASVRRGCVFSFDSVLRFVDLLYSNQLPRASW